MKTANELLHLDKWNSAQYKVIDIAASFVWFIDFVWRSV